MRFDHAHRVQSLPQTGSLLWYEDRESLKKLSWMSDILPEHYFIFRGRFSTTFPEVALMCAVLEDAFDCFYQQFVSRSRRAKSLSREAEKWFFSDDSESIFSFVSICTVLGLDPNVIRRRLGARGAPRATLRLKNSRLKKRRFVKPQQRQVA